MILESFLKDTSPHWSAQTRFSITNERKKLPLPIVAESPSGLSQVARVDWKNQMTEEQCSLVKTRRMRKKGEGE